MSQNCIIFLYDISQKILKTNKTKLPCKKKHGIMQQCFLSHSQEIQNILHSIKKINRRES